VDWINLARDRVQWQTVVNIVIDPCVLLRDEEFLDQLSDC